jgi:dsDNA-specific endonuclease/ATPase MutS2
MKTKPWKHQPSVDGHEFKVGDRVRWIGDLTGARGTVVEYRAEDGGWLVAWDGQMELIEWVNTIKLAD